jgi:hypothetical protein
LQFELRVRRSFKTNGGFMIDANVTFEDKETTHRVIVGRDYFEEFDMQPEDVLVTTFEFLLRKKVPRQTEGEGFLGSRRVLVMQSENRACREL